MSTVVVINQFLSGYDTPLTGFCPNLRAYALWWDFKGTGRRVPTRSVAGSMR